MFGWQQLKAILMDRRFLWILFWINLLGTIYGYYWYKDQLLESPPMLLPFVPDSPTSSLFFTITVFLWLWKRSSPVIEMLALMTSFKYGLWAVAVLSLYGIDDGYIHPANLMLIVSHAGMAVEVLLYSFAYRFKPKHIWIGAIWLLVNDFLDYTFDIHPWLEDDRFIHQVAVFTVCLSIVTILLTTWLTRKRVQV